MSRCSEPDTPPQLLAVLRFDNSTGDTRFDQFHLLLRKRLEYEMLLPGVAVKACDAAHSRLSDIDPADTARFRYLVHGGFSADSATAETVLRFQIEDRGAARSTGKRLALRGMSLAEAADIVVLKAADFLRQNVLSKLSISSSPPGCRIALDGVAAGLTPQEFALQPGTYRVQIRGSFLSPYECRVELDPGKSAGLHAAMRFRGYPTHWWLLAAVLSTGATAAAGALESRYHRDYRSLPPSSSPQAFADAYDSYRNANTVRLALEHITIVPWTGTVFCFFVNRSLERRVAGK